MFFCCAHSHSPIRSALSAIARRRFSLCMVLRGFRIYAASSVMDVGRSISGWRSARRSWVKVFKFPHMSLSRAAPHPSSSEVNVNNNKISYAKTLAAAGEYALAKAAHTFMREYISFPSLTFCTKTTKSTRLKATSCEMACQVTAWSLRAARIICAADTKHILASFASLQRGSG